MNTGTSQYERQIAHRFLPETNELCLSSLLNFLLRTVGQSKSTQEAILTSWASGISPSRKKISKKGKDKTPETLEKSRFFLGCPYYIAIPSSPSLIPRMRRYNSSAAVAEFKQTTFWLYLAIASFVVQSTSVLFRLNLSGKTAFQHFGPRISSNTTTT